MPLANAEDCWKFNEPNNWFCFGPNSNGDNACKGDSGGPVMVRKNNADGEKRWQLKVKIEKHSFIVFARWTLAGIISGTTE